MAYGETDRSPRNSICPNKLPEIDSHTQIAGILSRVVLIDNVNSLTIPFENDVRVAEYRHRRRSVKGEY